MILALSHCQRRDETVGCTIAVNGIEFDRRDMDGIILVSQIRTFTSQGYDNIGTAFVI